jgi:hypothetical protein
MKEKNCFSRNAFFKRTTVNRFSIRIKMLSAHFALSDRVHSREGVSQMTEGLSTKKMFSFRVVKKIIF